MLKKLIPVFLASFLLGGSLSAQALEGIQAINQVWAKFYKAFETLDYTLMAEIHSEDLIRISGGERISDYDSYIAGYQLGFENAKAQNETNRIELRFFERIFSDSIASDRGIYKLIRNEDQTDEGTYYGQFHVLFKKANGDWKILMDYDSNPENSIGEEQFMKSHPIDSIQYFLGE